MMKLENFLESTKRTEPIYHQPSFFIVRVTTVSQNICENSLNETVQRCES